MNQSNEQNQQDNLWPKELDAMIAATDHHEVLLENDQVRVLDTVIRSGATVPLHTHCWPSVMYVMSFSEFVRFDEGGNVLLDTRTITEKPKPGQALWSAPLPPHSLTNVGSTDLRVITVELKGTVPKD